MTYKRIHNFGENMRSSKNIKIIFSEHNIILNNLNVDKNLCISLISQKINDSR